MATTHLKGLDDRWAESDKIAVVATDILGEAAELERFTDASGRCR